MNYLQIVQIIMGFLKNILEVENLSIKLFSSNELL